MAFPAQFRQALSDMHDECLARRGETVVRVVTLGQVTYKFKMVVSADGEITLRARKMT